MIANYILFWALIITITPLIPDICDLIACGDGSICNMVELNNQGFVTHSDTGLYPSYSKKREEELEQQRKTTLCRFQMQKPS